MVLRHTVVFIISCSLVIPYGAFADPSKQSQNQSQNLNFEPPKKKPKKPKKPLNAEQELQEIPKEIVAPKPLGRSAPVDPFLCPRFYSYEGRVLLCDSNLDADAENLRPIFKDTPAALADLDHYQKTRLNVRNLAYLGTFGLMMALTGVILESEGRTFRHSDVTYKNISYLGLGITAGSFMWGLYLLGSNESRLRHSVENYNAANPSKPIELQIGTKVSF